MADKVLKLGTNGVEEYVPITTTTGVSDAGKIIATDANGKLDTSILPDGIGADVKVVVASEALTAGDFVNLWNDTDTIKARKADASQGFTKNADGYVKANVSQSANATVYFDGTNTLTGLTIGSKYYLSATAGTATATAPTTAGHIRQYLGKALSATELNIEIEEPILRS